MLEKLYASKPVCECRRCRPRINDDQTNLDVQSRVRQTPDKILFDGEVLCLSRSHISTHTRLFEIYAHVMGACSIFSPHEINANCPYNLSCKVERLSGLGSNNEHIYT